MKLNPYDLEWSGENRARLVEEWDKMIKDGKRTVINIKALQFGVSFHI